MIKNLPLNAGDIRDTGRRHKRCRLDPWSGRSSADGNSSPLQYSCLKNPTDRGDWRATAHGVTKCQTQVSMHTDSRKIIVRVQ